VPDCQDYRRFNDTIALIEKEIAEMNDRVARNGRALGYGISGHVICCETREEAEAHANSFGESGKLAATTRARWRRWALPGRHI
jgi:alkanesulfonate monooxygenase SsuD/methylene tetrahydromethanopterin reductase-like flavin-dependent oxidoreductase (luciferase family)